MKFLDAGGLTNPKAEFYIPTVVSEIIASGAASVSVLSSAGRWFGVTYREDRHALAAAMARMVNERLYPTPL